MSCLSVPGALLRDIEQGLTASENSLSLAAGHAAEAWERSFFVAAEIDGPEREGPGDVGVWFVTGLVVPGTQTIQSVSELATQLSSFDEAQVGSTRVTASAGGVAEARACLEEFRDS